MGHTWVKIKIFSADRKTSKEVELLVDTGSTYTWVLADNLHGLGISPKEKKLFKTIEGRTVERQIGEALIEYNGETVTTIVVFALPSDSQVFGVYALEGLGLEIDPLTKTLKKAEALLAI